MKQPFPTASDFHFELSANGEQTSFEEAVGISTEVVLPRTLKEGENPFKYRLPSMPKTGNLVLKNGRSSQGSKLMQWCASAENPTPEAPLDKNKVELQLKDANGRLLLEWTLYNAYPVKNSSINLKTKTQETEIKDLELAYSFYTFSKK